MKRLTIGFAVVVAAVGVAPSVGARVSPAPAVLKPAPKPALVKPALVKPALVKPALVKPALVKPALVKPALVKPAPVRTALVRSALVRSALVRPAAAEWCPDRPDGDCTLAPPQAPSGSAKSASSQPKVVPRPASDPRGRSGWRSGCWYME